MKISFPKAFFIFSTLLLAGGFLTAEESFSGSEERASSVEVSGAMNEVASEREESFSNSEATSFPEAYDASILDGKINLFSEAFKFTFQTGLGLESGTDFLPKGLGSDFLTVYDQKEFVFYTGVRFFQESFNITHEVIYWPTLFEHFNLGVGTIFHWNDYYNVYTELDFLTGLYFRYDTLKRFNTTTSILYFRKNATVFAGDKQLNLHNNNMALKFGFEFTPVNKFKINLDISSYSFYRYMLFFAPDIDLKLSLNISENFTTGLEFDVQYVDLFTLSANFNCATIRTFVSMEI